MKVFTNTTSPYARIARIALIEKGFDLRDTRFVNPWADDPGLMAVNSAARVPAVELDSGTTLSESLLIVMWLERVKPAPSLLAGEADGIIANSGVVMGIIDAAAQIVTGKMQWDPDFADHRVGLRRRRTILAGMDKLNKEPPSYQGATPDIAVVTCVVALDYIKLRFGDESWVQTWPNLEALRGRVAGRQAFRSTEPYL